MVVLCRREGRSGSECCGRVVRMWVYIICSLVKFNGIRKGKIL